MWTKDFVANMKTHENTDGEDDTLIEFCYFDNYCQLNENFSTSIISSTPHQAWRAGFRECAKLASPPEISGITAAPNHWKKRMISIWTSIGSDQPYGCWVIRGAKDGLKYASLNRALSQNLLQINNEEWLRNYFNRKYVISPKPSQKFVP